MKCWKRDCTNKVVSQQVYRPYDWACIEHPLEGVCVSV